MAGEMRIAPTATATMADVRIIGNLPLRLNGSAAHLFRNYQPHQTLEDNEEDAACAN
jgi:hypothetical protein